MKFLNTLLAGGTLALLCGCSVMNFKNGPVEPASAPVEKWHHNVALSLIEVSKPVDLKTLCDGSKWSMVTTEETFATGLVGSLDDIATSALLRVGIDIWNPQMVVYTCGAK